MIYLYDKAIAEDLRKSFNPNNIDQPLVQVVDPEGTVDLVAAMKEDKVTYPIVSLYRDPDSGVDISRINFARLHRGVAAVVDPNTNMIYYEKVLPINLRYELSVFTTNTADMDEILREMLFKYVQMYFLSITLPYEASRKIRFGIRVDPEGIQRESGSVDYIRSGQLHKAKVPLVCDGCVLVDYTPAKLKKTDYSVEAVDPNMNLI